MRLLTFLLVFNFIYSCSNTRVLTEDRVKIQHTKNLDHSKKFNFAVKKEFYLWGLIPNEHKVFIDKELQSRGYTEVSQLELIDGSNSKDTFFSILSLGLYTPKTFQILGRTRVK